MYCLNAGREVDWVQCDGGCNEWFHMLCVGLIKSQMKPEDEFICKKCKSKKPTNSTAAAANSTSSSSTSKKTKTQINYNNTATANGNGTTETKKRFTRSKEEAMRDKAISSTAASHANENSIDSSKENEPRPNVSPKRESQSINASRPKEKSN